MGIMQIAGPTELRVIRALAAPDDEVPELLALAAAQTESLVSVTALVHEILHCAVRYRWAGTPHAREWWQFRSGLLEVEADCSAGTWTLHRDVDPHAVICRALEQEGHRGLFVLNEGPAAQHEVVVL